MIGRFAAATLAAAFVPATVTAQPARLIGQFYSEQKVVCERFGVRGQSCKVYKPFEDGAPQLYIDPIFIFGASQDGAVNVRVTSNEGGTAWDVALDLLVSPAAMKEALATAIRRDETLAGLQHKYSALQSSQLITPIFVSYSIKQHNGTAFQPVDSHVLSGQTAISLTATFPDRASADALADRITRDVFRPSFEILYKVNAVFTQSQSTASARRTALKATNAGQRLLGTASASRIALDPQRATVSQEPLYVTRSQKRQFEAALRGELAENWKITKPEHLAILQERIEGGLKELFPEEKRKLLEFGPQFADELKRLSAYDFAKEDLDVSAGAKFASDIKKEFQSKTNTDDMIKAEASGSYGGASGSVKGEHSRKEAQEILEKNSWVFTQDAGPSVPKGLDVYVLDSSRLTGDYSVSVVLEEVQGGELEASTVVDTASRLQNPTSPWAPSRAPVGAVVAWAGRDGSGAEKDGWWLCDGRPVRQGELPELFAVIGTTYGDGSDAQGQKAGDFNLPNYQGYFLRGRDPNSRIDKDGASRVGADGRDVAQADQLKSHSHVVSPERGAILVSGLNNTPGTGFRDPGDYYMGLGTSRLITQPQPDGGGETRPTNMAVHWLIRVQ